MCEFELPAAEGAASAATPAGACTHITHNDEFLTCSSGQIFAKSQ